MLTLEEVKSELIAAGKDPNLFEITVSDVEIKCEPLPQYEESLV